MCLIWTRCRAYLFGRTIEAHGESQSPGCYWDWPSLPVGGETLGQAHCHGTDGQDRGSPCGLSVPSYQSAQDLDPLVSTSGSSRTVLYWGLWGGTWRCPLGWSIDILTLYIFEGFNSPNFVLILWLRYLFYIYGDFIHVMAFFGYFCVLYHVFCVFLVGIWIYIMNSNCFQVSQIIDFHL